MRRLLRATKHNIVKPVYRATRYMVVANVELWGKTFWQEWELVRWDKKLIWLLFVNQTIAIITLIELITFTARK